MDPLSPQDPLYKLLGKSRSVEPRPNFTQNVLRAVRQLPVEKPGLGARISNWISQPFVWTGAAALAAVVWLGLMAFPPSGGERTAKSPARQPTAQLAQTQPVLPTENEVASEVDGMNQLGVLLVQQDTKSMSDSDIAALLY